uniref:F-box associated domain-containing protein n=1 Tax=Oryza glumipatula TaxID=40148 RepID=A0A0D9Z7D1_9ORYZ
MLMFELDGALVLLVLARAPSPESARELKLWVLEDYDGERWTCRHRFQATPPAVGAWFSALQHNDASGVAVWGEDRGGRAAAAGGAATVALTTWLGITLYGVDATPAARALHVFDCGGRHHVFRENIAAHAFFATHPWPWPDAP